MSLHRGGAAGIISMAFVRDGARSSRKRVI
jgi:hypothetical protein